MKPVAWRYENKNVKGVWYITWTEPPDGFNKRPLYEHQPEDETAWRELDDERVAYINRVGDILGQVGEDSLEDTATRVMQQLASRDEEVAELRQKLDKWVEKAKNWTASPEAGKMLDGYRAMGAKCAELESERDQVRQELAERDAELKRINHALNDNRVDLTITAAEAITALRQQLAERKKQIVILRETLCSVSTSLPAWQQKKVMDAIAATDPKQ